MPTHQATPDARQRKRPAKKPVPAQRAAVAAFCSGHTESDQTPPVTYGHVGLDCRTGQDHNVVLQVQVDVDATKGNIGRTIAVRLTPALAEALGVQLARAARKVSTRVGR